MIPVFDRVENNVGKGENAGYQHFLLFPQCFLEAFFSGLLKVRIVRLRIKDLRRKKNEIKGEIPIYHFPSMFFLLSHG